MKSGRGRFRFREWLTWRRVLCGVVVACVLVLAAIGARTVCLGLRWRVVRWRNALAGEGGSAYVAIPVSKLPGPRRTWQRPVFTLNETNSLVMAGMDDPLYERWCDIAGNFYANDFVSGFSYERPGPDGPLVRVRVEPEATVLKGRLEARGLKPNFAYQLKLRGIYSATQAFETIGFLGRWRLPGLGTNYRDEDYLAYAEKGQVEAYVLFDFFTTDANGNAARDYALDSTLHVLWNASRQRQDALGTDLVPVIIDARSPRTYARPKPWASVELLWAEREGARYETASQAIRLPPGDYYAELVLTEESFHSKDNDGGFWATVYKCPVSFTIIETPTVASP